MAFWACRFPSPPHFNGLRRGRTHAPNHDGGRRWGSMNVVGVAKIAIRWSSGNLRCWWPWFEGAGVAVGL